MTGNDGAATFAQSTGDPQVTVSASGAVSAPDDLAVGTYTATGTDTDPLGDTGTWSYQLTVLAGTISQSSPTGSSVTAGSALSDQLVVMGNNGAATFAQSTGDPQVTVSGSARSPPRMTSRWAPTPPPAPTPIRWETPAPGATS